MKNQLPLVGIIVIVLVLLISGCQEKTPDGNNENASDFSTYENVESGFSIDYPTAWNKYENPAQVPDVDVLFSSPSNEPTKTGNLMVTVLDNVSLTMEQFKHAHEENLSILISDFNVIYENVTTLSDLPGYELVFTFTSDIYTWRQLEVWTILGDTLYLLVHQADQAYYENFTADVERMTESFSILDVDVRNSQTGDFYKFIGTWGDGTTNSITFREDGTYSSDNDGSFAIEDGKLVLTDVYDSVDNFEYAFSDEGEALTLTDLETGVVAILDKMEG